MSVEELVKNNEFDLDNFFLKKTKSTWEVVQCFQS